MDEEELEGLLPRTDLDNASQGTVSTQDALLGTPINAPAGVGAPSDKVSIPSFGQPGAGVMPAMPAMPTVDQVAPAVETYGGYFPSVTTLESQPLSPSQEADLFGAKALDDARRNGTLKETELVKVIPSSPLNEQQKMDLVQPIGAQPLSESEKADLLEMQGLDNLRNNGADSLMGAYDFPESELVKLVPSDPVNEGEMIDFMGEATLDDMRRNGPGNLAEALGNAPSNGAIPLPELTRESSQFEGSAIMPDGSTKGYLVGGGSRTMSPEEISAFETARNAGTANQYSVPMGEYQNVPGTQGSVSLPLPPSAPAPTPTPTPAPAPATEQPVTPAEQADAILDSNNLAETSLVRLNPRALTTADVNNPALDGMSAGEKIAAVNAPGYQSPDLAAIPAGGGPTSKLEKFGDFATGVLGGASDISLGVAKLGLSPFTMAKDYLMGTEGNKNPSFLDVTSDTYDSITDTPMTDFLSGRSAQERAAQATSEQDQRNRDFLAKDTGVQYQDGVQIVESDKLTPEQMNEFMGAEGSPQRAFVDKVTQGPLNEQEIRAGYAYADRNQMNFDPQSGFSKRPAFSTGPINRPLPNNPTGYGTRPLPNNPPGFGTRPLPNGRGFYRELPGNIDPGFGRSGQIPGGLQDLIDRINRDRGVGEVSNLPFYPGRDGGTQIPLDGPMNASQFMRYEDNPANRTEQFVDPQGRLRRRLTPQASYMQGNPAGVQPLAPEYNSFEDQAAARELRLDASSQGPSLKPGGRQASIAAKQGGYSDGDLRKIFGGGKRLQRAKALAQNGIDPVTEKPFAETASDARTAELRQRVLEAEAVAKERGEDPAEARQRILNNQLLEERIKDLRQKGLPEDITMRQGDFGTIIVSKGGKDISYFKQGDDLEAQLRAAGLTPNDTMNATGGSGNIPTNAVDLLKKNPETRDQFDKKYGAGSADKVLGSTEGSTRD